jgi:hypothetical protein
MNKAIQNHLANLLTEGVRARDALDILAQEGWFTSQAEYDAAKRFCADFTL